MDSLIVRYAFSRFFGIGLLVLACWNFYLLRLLNEWLPTDLIRIGVGIGGCYLFGMFVLWKARILRCNAPENFFSGIDSIHRTLNVLFILILVPFIIGDAMTVNDFFSSVKLVEGGEISEAAYVVRDVAIARISAFVLLGICLGVGAYRHGGKGPR